MPDHLRVRIVTPKPGSKLGGGPFLVLGFVHPSAQGNKATVALDILELDGTAVGITSTPTASGPASTPRPFDWGFWVTNVPAPNRPRVLQVTATHPGSGNQPTSSERVVIRCGTFQFGPP